MSDWIDDLERLQKLRDSGALSDADFKAAKHLVINNPSEANLKTPNQNSNLNPTKSEGSVSASCNLPGNQPTFQEKNGQRSQLEPEYLRAPNHFQKYPKSDSGLMKHVAAVAIAILVTLAAVFFFLKPNSQHSYPEASPLLEEQGNTSAASLRNQPEPTALRKRATGPRIPARSDPEHPVTQPPYPWISGLLKERGTVALNLNILTNGKVGDAKIKKSSGYKRLDEAAVSEALSNWHFLPATRGDTLIASWLTVEISFKPDK